MVCLPQLNMKAMKFLDVAKAPQQRPHYLLRWLNEKVTEKVTIYSSGQAEIGGGEGAGEVKDISNEVSTSKSLAWRHRSTGHIQDESS